MRNALLVLFIKRVGVFKYLVNSRYPMVRGLAMNSIMGAANGTTPAPTLWGFRGYNKMADIKRPTEYFMFMDEDDTTINDGRFRVDYSLAVTGQKINDVPANYHRG